MSVKNKKSTKSKATNSAKTDDLNLNTKDAVNTKLTTNQGVAIADDLNSLKIGERGPTLLEDFIFREKITHFDHERIPERVVHARGSAAHGYFELYAPLNKYTKARFLTDSSVKTPVFVRISTVAGSRGSADTVRDVRGFAVKFYTEDGVLDIVGNNIPVFFIQDAIKFPDLIHAVKPEPNNEIPQAATAHDTFWDFISLTPESMHMIMWIMSDRTIPRSLTMMEGFGVHTFRFINDEGKSHFVKFHWKPKLGVHSMVWDEAQKISGKDADFHRRDLYEAIESGNFPEWELGVQIIDEKDEFKFAFDLLDPTKLIPEEIVPVQIVGKMTLNRNPDNFFAETEQVAFHPGHIVPGIDFSNDPLLQGRLFSYLDTQISRLGGPNFHEIPINRPLCPFHNQQRDGMHRQTINTGKVAYHPNTLDNNFPQESTLQQGGFNSYAENISGSKIRVRSSSFADHFSQASMFWNSQSPIEKQHIIEALQFELGKVETVTIRESIVEHLANIDSALAKCVAHGLGLVAPAPSVKHNLPTEPSQALSMANTTKNSIQGRKIALLVVAGFDKNIYSTLHKGLLSQGASVKIIAPHSGNIKADDGTLFKIDHAIQTTSSVLFDAVVVLGNVVNKNDYLALYTLFVHEAYKHFKTIAITDTQGKALLPENSETQDGVLVVNDSRKLLQFLISAIAMHRHWKRTNTTHIAV